MPTPLLSFFKLWCSWGLKRLRKSSPVRLGVTRLEDRTVPTFGGGVAVAAGDWDADGYRDIVTGAGAGGGPHVKVFSGRTGDEVASFYAYDPGFTGGVNVALADVTGDGRLDLITGAGAGGGPHVKVFDGTTLGVVFEVMAYDARFTGGVSVAAADLDGDGRAEIITGAGSGGGPHVRVFSAASGAVVREFMAYDTDFRGGVWVAGGDLTGDGVPEVVTGAGAGGGPHVKAFDGAGGGELLSTFAYEPGFAGGVRVAVGDLDGDGVGEVITGAGAGGGPHVRAIRVNGDQFPWPIGNTFAYDEGFRGGVFLATADLDADGRADLVTGAGAGGGPHVRAFRSGDATELAGFMAYAPDTRAGGFAQLGGVPSRGNTPPTVSSFADLELVTGTTSYPIPFVVDDAETDARRLVVRVTSDNPLLVPAVGLVLGGTGRNRTLTVTPAAGRVGSARVVVTVRDEAGAVASSTLRLTVTAVSTAPALISMADFAVATAFLYTGANPLQTGVATGTIDTLRAAVVRGRVLNVDGTPLAGVTVTVLSHPEFGQTLTQSDGYYNLAVNGGGLLTISYALSGHLPIQRQTQTPWRDYVVLDDVALTPLDSRVTSVDLNSAAPIQVARGKEVTDDDGTRQATLLFTQGTSATMTLPDGSVQSLSTLSVRATEYTVGASGPMAMPGTLPATSGYTYAVELSVDEAMAAGATNVTFSQAVSFYVENFLSFPVGSIVPAGYYDRSQGIWMPDHNGQVIQVLSITGGLADLDTDGDGDADTASELALLGVTVAEQSQLATLYTAGESLWRVPITHFTPWDFNWPFGPPDDAINPDIDPDELKDEKPNDEDEQCPASVIYIQSQTLGESISVAGTPFTLNYISDRSEGYTENRKLSIPLVPESYPSSLRRVELTIAIAGQVIHQSFTPSTNLRTSFVWDGLDVYGRKVDGAAAATVDVSYMYDGVYYGPAQLGNAFGQLSGNTTSGDRTRQEIGLTQTLTRYLGATTSVTSSSGIGGWTLDIQHSYDPAINSLNFGNGQTRVAGSVNLVITTVAGDGSRYYGGDGIPATMTGMFDIQGVATGPDGSLYISYREGFRILKINSDGIVTTVAGNGIEGGGGDGGLATQAELSSRGSLTISPDGSLYFIDGNRIRRVSPDGIIETVAGQVDSGWGGDGGPATQAKLDNPSDIAIGPDGSLYIADSWNNMIRRVGTDGIITTLAGDVSPVSSINSPTTIAIGPDGSIYFAEQFRGSVSQLKPDGTISIFAGDYPIGFGGDGGPATQAKLGNISDIAVGADGSVYISDGPRIRRVDSVGIISTIAGNGGYGFTGDGVPATQAALTPGAIALATDGTLYFVDYGEYLGMANYIRRIAPSLPGFSATDLAIPSEDGTELYRFDATGRRHLQTLDALTGTVIYNFSYNDAGQLMSVTDREGKVTTIERSVNGTPIAIVAPHGQRTTLTLNADGCLIVATNPAGETTTIGYGTGGLLTSFADPLGNAAHMTYDADGRLIEDVDAASGSTRLVREELGGGSYKVTVTNAVNGTRQYVVEKLPDGSRRRTFIDGRGFATVTVTGTDGTKTTTSPDGTVITTVYGPDPRFGMNAPVPTTQTITTPSRLTSTTTTTRTATFATPDNPDSGLATFTETVNVNGQAFTKTYDATARTITSSSAAGRTSVSILDELGRTATVQTPGVADTHFTYNSEGQLVSVSQGSRTIMYAYTALGQLASIRDPLGRTTSFTYDAADRLTKQTRPDGSLITFRYDAAGNLVGLTPPGQPEHTFTYDSVGQLTETDPPEAFSGDDTTNYTYNLARQLIRETLPNGSEIDYAYCECGRLTSITTPWGNYTYNYSETTGELSSIIGPDGFTLSSEYDGFLLTGVEMTGPVSGNVNWTYDNNFRVTSESVNGAFTVGYAYDADSLLTQAGELTLTRDSQNGRLTGTTLGTVADTLNFDTYGELSGYQVTVGGVTGLEYSFTRDQLGRITRKVETTVGVTTTTDYGYDAKGQLTTVTVNGVLQQTYVYDANGNRLSLTTSSGVETGVYDAQDRLLSYGTKSYTYTADGSLRTMTDSATGQTTTYTYDGFGNLTRVDLPDGRVVEYLIDPQNRRVGKKVNGILSYGLVYNGQLTPAAMVDAGGTVVARFVYGTHVNVPEYMIQGGVTYRIITDHLGSVRMVVNAGTGEVVQRLEYDAFGRVLVDTNPGFQPFGYAGGLYDTDTHMLRFGAREYSPDVGRWATVDPIGFAGKDSNLYRYAGGNTLLLIDPDGLEPISALSGSDRGGISLPDVSAPPQPVTRIFDANDDVTIVRDGKELSCKKGDPIYPGDRLKTGDTGRAAYIDEDGLLQRLNPNSLTKFRSPDDPPYVIDYTTSYGGGQRG